MPPTHRCSFRSICRFFLCLSIAGLFVLHPKATFAQTATISGFVSDASDGQPLELVNVAVYEDNQLIQGTVSNQDGAYVLNRIPPGTYEFVVSFIGYEVYRDSIRFRADVVINRSITLTQNAEAMDEVIVQTERVSGAARVTAGQQTIRPEDLELLPSPDVTPDLVNYLTSLPGVVSVGDRGGQLFIRGGEPSQNLVLLDRMIIYQPFHVLGFYSAFPGDILNRSDIYAGGFGSRFGGRISSVIDVLTRNGNNRKFAGAASLSPFVSSIRLEGPIIPSRVSFIASVRESFIEQGAAQYIDTPLPFAFGDVFAKIHAEMNARNRFSFSYLRTHDRGTLLQEVEGGTPAEDIRWNNTGFGMRWVMLPRFISASAELDVSYTRFESRQGLVAPLPSIPNEGEFSGQIRPSDVPPRKSTIENTHVGLDVSFIGDRVDGHAGVSVRLTSLDSQLEGLFQNIDLRRVSLDEAAQYVQLDFKIGEGLRISPGVRIQFYQVSIDPRAEPRLRIVWDKGIHQVSTAFGLYNQEITGITDRRDAASIFTAWTSIPQPTRRNLRRDIRSGRLPGALHFILGYRLVTNDNIELAVEGFLKDIDNLFVPEWTAFPRFTTNLQPATGKSAGFDVRAEWRGNKVYASVNYGYSNTTYSAEQASIQLWYGEETLEYRPPHDRRHQINAISSWELLGFDMSMKWEFGSGLPFNRAIGFDAFILIDDLVNVVDIPGAERVIYERPYNGILPAYHRLDFSMSRAWEFGNSELTLQGSMINLYNRKNLFYLDVFTLQQVNQLPFVPTLGVQFSFN
ncbi:MAG: TonB-dependent receptor [Rhodothermaceae bacterium]|nr:TonB-dependent receptor [Rhodothermaceae bacterium]